MNRAIAVFPIIHLMTATMSFGADISCLMSEQQQRNTILSEGPKAIHDQATSDCFQRLVKDEWELLKRDHSPLANDKLAVIQSMLHTSLREDGVKTESAE